MTAHSLEATTYVFSELLHTGLSDQNIAREPDGRSIVAIRAALSTGTLPRDLAARAEEILRASFQDRRNEAEGALIDRAISECMDAQGCPRPGRPEANAAPAAEQGARPAPDGTDIGTVISRMREKGAHVAVERGPGGEVSRLRVIGGAPGIDAHWVGPSYAAGRMRAWLEAHGTIPLLAEDIQEALGRWRGPWTVLGMANEHGNPHDYRPPAPWRGNADAWIQYGWPYAIVTPEIGPGGFQPRSHVASGIQSRPAADMMAAAPEMLAALRGLLEYADNGMPLRPGSDAWEAARAAVAKAAGGQGRPER